MPTDVDGAKAQTLFGDYVQSIWWPTWKAQHPDSAYQTGKRIERRILPFFGSRPFAALDADQVGAWKAGARQWIGSEWTRSWWKCCESRFLLYG